MLFLLVQCGCVFKLNGGEMVPTVRESTDYVLTGCQAHGYFPDPLSSTCCWMMQKKTQENINSRLTLVMKSGKFTLGYKSTLKSLRSGKCKPVVSGCLCACIVSPQCFPSVVCNGSRNFHAFHFALSDVCHGDASIVPTL